MNKNDLLRSSVINNTISEVEAMKKIRGGINSSLYYCRTKTGKEYAIKKYPNPSRNDPRKRCLNEARALVYLNENKIDNTSEIINYCEKENIGIFKWIEGDKKEKVDEAIIKKIGRFIGETNEDRLEKYEYGFASESLRSIEDYSNILNNRMERLKKYKPDNNEEEEIRCWIMDVLEPYTKIAIQYLATCKDKSEWKEMEEKQIFSQSDVGLHNMLEKGDKIFFVDFEYAGKDDMAKLYNDWVLNPNYLFNSSEADLLRDSIIRETQGYCDSWVYRAIDMNSAVHAKWCMIILNKYINGETDRKLLERVKHYYKNGLIGLDRK